jgi:hypothetical protein
VKTEQALYGRLVRKTRGFFEVAEEIEVLDVVKVIKNLYFI